MVFSIVLLYGFMKVSWFVSILKKQVNKVFFYQYCSFFWTVFDPILKSFDTSCSYRSVSCVQVRNALVPLFCAKMLGFVPQSNQRMLVGNHTTRVCENPNT